MHFNMFLVHKGDCMLIAKSGGEEGTKYDFQTTTNKPLRDEESTAKFIPASNSTSTAGSVSTSSTASGVVITAAEANNNKVPYKTVGPEDDELHDSEIIAAVRNSLRLWKQGKLNKTSPGRHNR
jgi:hypothetical protein